jgi:integrase
MRSLLNSKVDNLTNTAIGKLEPDEKKEYVVSDTEIQKLKIRVTPKGSKIFYLFWKKNGKQNKYRIGKFGDIGLPAARKSAEKLLAKISLDENPQADRAKERVVQKQEAGAILRAFLDEQYYPWSIQHQKAPDRTKQILEFNFKSFMNNRMGSITKSDMDRWSRKKLAEGINPTTINRATSAIVAVLNKAVEWEIINSNPIGKRKRLKVDKRGVVRYLSADEESRLLKALETKKGHIALLVPLLLNTGARPAEAFSLTWDNVDLEDRLLTLQAAFTKTSQTRFIPINDKLLKVLDAQESKTGFLFPSNMTDSHIVSIDKGWKYLKKDAKIENFRLYDCRHTFASKLVMRGIDLYTVSELLGHSSVEMTKIYAHLSPEHLQSAVDVL